MLVRAYRLTDRLGVVILKSSAAALDGLTILVSSTSSLVKILLSVFLVIFAGLQWLFSFISPTLASAFDLGARFGRQTARATGDAATGAMARRSARAEMEAGLAEDPLRTQNRILSALIVIALIAVIAVVLWASSNQGQSPTVLNTDNILLDNPDTSNDQGESLVLATPVPTATSLPEVLQARGSVAFVKRERSQTDIWASPVDSRAQIRLTNSPADERDPAWSPDGQRLAYASNQDGNWEIYIYDLARDMTTQMTYNLAFEAGPDWSPDGEFLVYESYQRGSHLDIFVMRTDGSEPGFPIASSDSPDFSPAWSPSPGRQIAFVSWRDGNQDIYIFNLDSQEIYNLTNTPNRQEENPAWSPDGRMLAYSAVEAGIETVFIKPVDDPNAPAEAFQRGHTPSWSPDGRSLIFAVDASDNALIIAAPYVDTAVATGVIQAPLGAGEPVWTSAPLPAALVNSGGLEPGVEDELFVEQVDTRGDDPPYGLASISNISGADPALLSDRVNDSFNALRERVNEEAGWDFLGRLSDALWLLDHRPARGEPRRNWHLTGRAFSFNRNLIVGFPPPVEIFREDTELATYWRVYVRVADDAQDGQLGEPLRDMPWDFLSADPNRGDVEAYNEGGRLRSEMPSGYYIDFTQLAHDYGWMRIPAAPDWRANANGRNYWMFVKADGLAWYEAMRELYPESQLGAWVPTPTPAPTETPASEEG